MENETNWLSTVLKAADDPLCRCILNYDNRGEYSQRSRQIILEHPTVRRQVKVWKGSHIDIDNLPRLGEVHLPLFREVTQLKRNKYWCNNFRRIIENFPPGGH